MILAAPLVIPFAKAVGLSVGTLGMAALADKVNDYIEANPEESAMILKTLIPNLGIGEIFMNKEKISIEDLDKMSDQEAADLPTDIKADLMKQGGKSRGGGKRELMKELSRKLGLSGPGKEQKDMEYDADERYEGGVTEKADGGAIGVESLFEERTPFRFGGRGYQGGRNTGVSRPGGRSAAMGMGGKQRGGTFSAPTPTGGGGPSGGGSTKKVSPIKKIGGAIDKGLTFISPFVDPSSRFGKGVGLYNLLKKGVTTIGDTLFTPVGAAEIDFSKLPQAKDKFTPDFGGMLDATSVLKSKYKGKTKEDFVNALETGKFGVGGQSMFDRNVGDLFEGVDLGKKGTFSFGDVSPTLIGTDDGSFRQTIDIDKEAIDPDDLKKLPGGFFKAEGGRVGFNVGGITDPAALSIYNSMNAYGFSDQEIADAITAQGYDAGTLGQTTTPDIPTAPTSGEGIIGIDLQQRDTGDAFSPFGPLQSTFTKDLSEVEGFDYLTPFEQMNKYKAQTQDNMFGLGRFFQPKIKGTLGNRLQKQFQTGQKLPSVFAKVAGAQSPFNIDSKNYNPDFVDQLNYLELGDDLIGMSSVGLKYGSGSVLAGKNVISGFGTNNYQKALEKFIAKTKSDKRRKQGEIELQNFLNAEKARKERERKEKEAIAEAARRTQYGPIDYGRGSDGQQSYDFGQGFGIGATTGGPVSNRTGRGRQDYSKGGLASMFVEKR